MQIEKLNFDISGVCDACCCYVAMIRYRTDTERVCVMCMRGFEYWQLVNVHVEDNSLPFGGEHKSSAHALRRQSIADMLNGNRNFKDAYFVRPEDFTVGDVLGEGSMGKVSSAAELSATKSLRILSYQRMRLVCF